jgi:hypothetical protein
VIPAALSMLMALFSALGKLFELLYARKLTDAGKVQAQLDALQQQVEAAKIAVAAREAQRVADLKRTVDGRVPIDETDPFLRD